MEDSSDSRVATDDFTKRVLKFAQHPGFVDFTIRCEGIDFNVNKLLVASHSTYFERVCLGWAQETSEGTITLKEDHLDAVKCMVHYFHSLDYDWDTPEAFSLSSSNKNIFAAQLHVSVFVVADKYDVPGLRSTCIKYLETLLNGLDGEDFQNVVLETTRYVYKLPTRDNSLRKSFLVFWNGMSLLASDSSSKVTEEGTTLEGLIAEFPAFGADLVRKFAPAPYNYPPPSRLAGATRIAKEVYRCIDQHSMENRIGIPKSHIISCVGASDAEVVSATTELLELSEIRCTLDRTTWGTVFNLDDYLLSSL